MKMVSIQNIQDILKQKFIRYTFVIAIIFLIVDIALPVIFLLPEIKEQLGIPLHYNIYLGVDLFGAWWRIFAIPLIGLVSLLLNAALIVYFWKKERLIAQIFAVSTAIVELLLLLAMIFIVLFNLNYA